MIGISTIEQNLSGAVIVPLDPTPLKSNTARIQRTATLDGGAVLSHFGISDGDRTVSVKGRVDDAISEAVWEIFQVGDLVNISIDDGFYRGAIESAEIENGEIKISILIGEKLSA